MERRKLSQSPVVEHERVDAGEALQGLDVAAVAVGESDVFEQARLAALRRNDDNEVKRFYEGSLAKTHDPVHARLNTQRKILTTRYSIWKRRVAYEPEMFLKNSPYRRGVA